MCAWVCVYGAKLATCWHIVRAIGKSALVFVAAVAAFVIGFIVGVNIVGFLERADMSGFNYLRDNLQMLIFALVAVFIGSSIVEEVIYRAF